jgi:hypothetical protein
MRRVLAYCFLIGVPSLLLAQAPISKPSFMDAGVIHHNGTTGTLTANDPRPLMQAIAATSQEYAWTVDYEDPPYRSHFDLLDNTDPVWRANHPNDKGSTRVSGGVFQSNIPEPSTISSGNAEEQVLQKLVSDYNSSGNPGKFVVRKEAEGRYAVVAVSRRDDTGKDETVDALLDAAISIPVQQRTATATLQLIVDTLSAKTGVRVYLGTIGLSSDPLQDVELAIGGSNVPARTLLLQTLDGASNSRSFRGILVWNFLFDADRNGYDLRLSVATKTETDAYGRQVVRPLERN